MSREIANTLEGRGANRKEMEITEDENCDLGWCINTISSLLKHEGSDLTEYFQNRLVEVNTYLSRIYVRNLHLDRYGNETNEQRIEFRE